MAGLELVNGYKSKRKGIEGKYLLLELFFLGQKATHFNQLIEYEY